MRSKLVVCVLLAGSVFIGTFCGISAAEDGSSATNDLQNVYQDTSVFDGGPGSTINTSPAANDAQQGRDPYQVPDVGEGVPVQ